MKARHYKAIQRLEAQFVNLRQQAGDSSEYVNLLAFAGPLSRRYHKASIAYFRMCQLEYRDSIPYVRARLAAEDGEGVELVFDPLVVDSRPRKQRDLPF